MSFLKQILKPFIEFEEETPEKTPSENLPPPEKPGSKKADKGTTIDTSTHPMIVEELAGSIVTDKIPTYAPTGSLDKPLPEHVSYFEKLIDEANRTLPSFKGVDYKEFIDNKIDIDDIRDESLKYTTAYNVLKSSGLTKAKLLQTGQEYVALIGKDLNRFQSAQTIHYKKELGPKEEIIRVKTEELLALQQKANAIKSEINALTQEVNLVKNNLQTVRNSFLLAGEMKQNEINEELKKIDHYFS